MNEDTRTPQEKRLGIQLGLAVAAIAVAVYAWAYDLVTISW
jgi:hypothetical protein